MSQEMMTARETVPERLQMHIAAQFSSDVQSLYNVPSWYGTVRRLRISYGRTSELENYTFSI